MLCIATTRHQCAKILRRLVNANTALAAASLTEERNWELSLTLCQLSRKKFWCSVHQIWGWCHQPAQSRLSHRNQSLVRHLLFLLVTSQAMRHPSSTRRRTQRPCRCRPPSFQANSKSLLTTSRDSLHLLSRLKRPKSPKTLLRSNRTSSQLPNQSKMSRRKTKEVPRVQEAKKRTRRKSTTTELSVPRQLLVEGKRGWRGNG